MPGIVNDPLYRRCSSAVLGVGIEESQGLGTDPALIKTRDARGRFAKGSSGNPKGRPRGIPNPRRRLPDLSGRRVSMEALSKLLDRKPHLWRPIAKQLMPPPLAVTDPAERLGIDLKSLHTAEDCRQVLVTVLAAMARGEVTPAEGARIAKRVRPRLRLFAKQVRAQFRALSRRVTGARTHPGGRVRPVAPAALQEAASGGRRFNLGENSRC